MVDGLLNGARILSVSELSGDSVNSAMPDGEVSYSKFQNGVHLVKLFYGLVTKMCDILK